jgi:hypothetical protein
MHNLVLMLKPKVLRNHLNKFRWLLMSGFPFLLPNLVSFVDKVSACRSDLFDNSFLFHFFLLPFGPRNRRSDGSDTSLVFLFFLLPFDLSFQKCSWI